MKSKLVTTLLCGFLGAYGGHRFYLGKIGTAILYLFTCGLFGIGTLVDMVKLGKNTLTDNNGQPLKNDDCPTWLPWVFVGLVVLAWLGVILSFVLAGGAIVAAVLGSM